MRHKLGLEKLSKPTDQRIALLVGLSSALIEYGRLKTTLTRAKAAQRMVEKLVTFAKKGTVAARREAYKVLKDRNKIKKLFELGPRFAERNGGYTRVTKVGLRKGDGVVIAQLEFVE